MSTSIASAIRRRANNNQGSSNNATNELKSTNNPQSLQSANNINSQNSPNNQGFTLPQVIALVDKRLVSLESFVKDFKDTTPTNLNSSSGGVISNTEQLVLKEVFQAVVEEFNNRFDILAVELNNLKDTVLKLQTYTMEVNSMLLNDRTELLKELENQPSQQLTTSSSSVLTEPLTPRNVSFNLDLEQHDNIGAST